MKPKLVFISNKATPYQVRFCEALQQHFDAEFWFWQKDIPGRPDWWRIELGDRCSILDRAVFRGRRPIAFGLSRKLRRFDPDIVAFGGAFVPINMQAFRWARRRRRTTVLMTEILRSRRSRPRGSPLSRWALRAFYGNLDYIFATSDEAVDQLSRTFGFGDIVKRVTYGADIDGHLEQPMRVPRAGQVTFLFANRLTAKYQPEVALEAFATAHKRFEGIRLLINGEGPLRSECESVIDELGIRQAVTFLDGISSWDELPAVYGRAHVLLIPASFTAGNFTVIEAMASGMGIVLSDKVGGGGAELIEHGRSGYIVQGTGGEFAACIAAYAEQPESIALHGAKNRELAKRYSLGNIAALWAQLLVERRSPDSA